jgi:heme exporter protein A
MTADGYCKGNELRAQALECLRGELLLFDSLALGIGAGDVLLVEGPNGAGKTSLLRMLAGLTLPEAGDVYWNGVPIRRQHATYAAALHYIGHQSALKSGLTVAENLRYSCGMTGGGNPDSAMQRVGVYRQRRQHVHTLSAGQRRRAALARLLLRPAPLWILDEPYTALDAAGVGLVNDLIVSHAGAGGMVVLASHQPLALSGLPLQRLRIGA